MQWDGLLHSGRPHGPASGSETSLGVSGKGGSNKSSIEGRKTNGGLCQDKNAIWGNAHSATEMSLEGEAQKRHFMRGN